MVSSSSWSIEDSAELYDLARWGAGFFGIAEQGDLVVHAHHEGGNDISLMEVIDQATRQGCSAPLIVRFTGILRQRIEQINRAFAVAIDDLNYGGRYRCFYPMKVNPHREVIAAAIESGRPFGSGVEVGSKAELMAMLMMTDDQIPILVNGFKDRTIFEMAFRAVQLGRDITVILEKPGEIDLYMQSVGRFERRPRLGVRVKLAARSGGRWSATGGPKSKFGMSISQLNRLVDQLKQYGLLNELQLLHFHPGSQIASIRKIKASLIEAAWIYADLIDNDVPLTILDVGGGLAVDYTGQRNSDPSSMNYLLEEYANDVVYYIQQVCQQAGIPEPDIVSESGRAITAHHSLLVVPILKNESTVESLKNLLDLDQDLNHDLDPNLAQLHDILANICPRNLSESYHDAQNAIETVWQMFSHGALTMKQRSWAECMFERICQEVAGRLDELDFVPNELSDLRHQLADTYIANFSVFQAIPDAWAMGQIFPVVPLHRLNERPSRRGVIGDISCDSDGAIGCFLGSNGTARSLPLHDPGEAPYYLGIFLIGAYQEALGDDHNLMGDFHVVTVSNDGAVACRSGSTTLGVLEHVHHSNQTMRDSLQAMLSAAEAQGNITTDENMDFVQFFEDVLGSYTYLVPHEAKVQHVKPVPHFHDQQKSADELATGSS